MDDDWFLDDEEPFTLTPDELKLLGITADDAGVTPTVDQFEYLARHYADRVYTLEFDYAAYSQIAGRELYFAKMRLGYIGRVLGADRLELVIADITRSWRETWDEDVARARESYQHFLIHGVWPPSD